MQRGVFDRGMMTQRWLVILLAVFLGLSLLGNLVQLQTREDRVVMLLPGEMSGPWEITRARFDRTYLADASVSLAEVYLETTPATAEWRRQAIMRWVHPAEVQKIADQIVDETENIKRQKLTSSFSISDVATSLRETEAEVRVVGQLTRFVTDKRFAQEGVVMTVRWRRDERGAATVSDLSWRPLRKNERADDFSKGTEE